MIIFCNHFLILEMNLKNKVMKNIYISKLCALFITSLLMLSCQKDGMDEVPNQNESVSQDILEKIAAIGYSVNDVQPIETKRNGKGYVVEGDIILHEKDFDAEPGASIRIAEVEQYRTNLLPVFGSSYYSTRLGQMVYRKEQITVLLEDDFANVYWDALREAANRYNAVSGLRFTILPYLENNPDGTLNPRNPDITISSVNEGYLAAAGSPREVTYTTRGGTVYTEIEPYNEILVSPATIGAEGFNHIATILSHEIGHCIGFRHTDYFNRRYSCGVEYKLDANGNVVPTNPNEDIEFPNNNPGSVHIPGTPTDEVEGSWMLACIDDGVNRPLVNNDRVALREIHGF